MVQRLVSVIQYFRKEVFVILPQILAVEVKENEIADTVVGVTVDLGDDLEEIVG
jgi:hypothetical protein